MAGTDLTGEVIDRRYRIVERIGGGAMGAVYRGARINLDRGVAIKVMHNGLPEGMKARERFEREAQMMAKIDHPHCVSIIDYGVHAQKPYVVMELVRGRSLFDMLAEHGRFEPARAIELMRQLLSGLAHAHEQGIVHRDIKPANLMVTPKAPLGLHLRILDFGLARMLGASQSLSSGMSVGTPSYMAPEQCRGDANIGAPVDIYACGVVLFELLTGKRPLTDKDPLVTVKKQMYDPPPRLADAAPGSYGELEAIVARALRKDPAERFASAIAMSDALDAVASARTAASSTAVMPQATGAPPSVSIEIAAADDDAPSARPPAPTEPRSRWWLAVLLLGGAAAGAVWWWRGHRSEVPARTAESTRAPVAVPPPPPPAVPADAAVGIDAASEPADAVAVAVIADAEGAADAGVGVVVDAGAAVASDAETPIVATAPPPADPTADVIARAEQLVAAGKTDAALELVASARTVYGDRASLPLYAGKLYLARMWWTDGVANVRAAIKLDPALRDDAKLAALAVKSFLTTPEYDARLGALVLDLGASTLTLLDDAAQDDRAPERRARAAAMAKRLRAR